jgi:hypothetical protein
MATCTIENLSGRLLTFVLTGAHLAKGGGPHAYKAVKTVTVNQAKNGALVPRSTHRAMAGSLRIPAGAKVSVDEAVTHCPAVKKAAAAGQVRIASDGAKTKSPAAPATTH